MFRNKHKYILLTAAALALCLFLQPKVTTFAALLNSASYNLNRLRVSNAADHTARFQTPTGVDAPTDTIILTYSSGFNLSAISINDIDLFHGAVTGLESSETLAAAAGVGVWGVAITPSTITFTAPTDAAVGEIPANNFVVIKIGTNAVGGTGQIINPAVAQNAVITVSGTFGDTKGMGVPIVADDRVTISAAVAPLVPPLPLPLPGVAVGDIIPPTIINPLAINITTSTAEIVWTTDESSNSGVEYGLTTAYSEGLVTDPAYVRSHSIKLTNLQLKTTYHFRVSSRDTANNLAVSGDFTFTTQSDTTAPIITNLQVVNITDTSALVLWNTNEPADSGLEYGTTQIYGTSVYRPGFVTAHSIFLTGLKPNTFYHFFVKSTDPSNNTAVSGDATFLTLPDKTAPSNVMDFKAVGGNGVVHLSWTLPPNFDLLGVRNVRRADGFPAHPSDGTVIYEGMLKAIDDTDVINGITYYYGAFAYDTSLNFSSGALAYATPLCDLCQRLSYDLYIVNIDGSERHTGTPWVKVTDLGNGLYRYSFEDATLDPNNIWFDHNDVIVEVDQRDCANLVLYFKSVHASWHHQIRLRVFMDGIQQSDTMVAADSHAAVGSSLALDARAGIDKVQACKEVPPTIPKIPPVFEENTIPLCSNGIDDDADGKIDCQDSDCAALQICMAPIPPLKPPIVVPVQPVPTPSGLMIVISPYFYTKAKTIELIPDSAGKIGVLPNSEVYVYLSTVGMGVEIERAYIIGSLFHMAPIEDGTAFEATLTMPSSGVYDISVVAEIKGGGTAVANYQFVVQKPGRVVEENVFGKTDIGIPGANVLLFIEEDGGNVWNGPAFGQLNPATTNDKGEYVFAVLNGRYYAVVEKQGYVRKVTDPVDIVNNVFNLEIGLIKTPPPFPLPAVIAITEPKIVAFINTIKSLLEHAVFGITVMRVTLQQPGLQNFIENFFSPALLAIALINLAAAIPVFNAITYLQYLFTQPILLIRRRKRKQWGAVFNSLTKQPVDLAIVRLLQAETHLVVQTMVTDKQGRYSFLVKEGNYIVEVVKPGYLFPTQYLQGKTVDVDFTDIYHAAPIKAADGQIIAPNIPLDPVTRVETPRQVLWRKTFRTVQQDLALLTVLAALTSLIIKPSAQVALLTLAQVGTYLLFKRLSAPVKAKEWGIVFDEKTRKPLDRAIVRIFDKKFNKLLETKVTDKNGKYGFFVRRNIYYVTAEKEGYEKYVSPDIDLTKKDEVTLDLRIALKISRFKRYFPVIRRLSTR